jgi:DNA-binding GntR family transcriptional regulator
MQKPKGIPVPTDSRTLPRLTELVAVARKRRRSSKTDDLRAMAHVLRVRSRLTADEQHSFDQLIADHSDIILGMLIDRSDDEATSAIRRHLASVSHTMPAGPRK